MKNKVVVLVLIFIMALSLAACKDGRGKITELSMLGGGKSESTKLKTIDDLKDKRIGVLLGSTHDTYATKNFPQATILQYKSTSDVLLAVKSGKVDVAFFASEMLAEILRSDNELGVLCERVFSDPIAIGFNKENDSLREQFNVFLKQIKENGLYDDMVSRWMSKGVTDMPVVENPKTNGTLIVGIVSDKGLPFTIVKDNKMIGFDVELVERFAAYLGKEPKLADMEFGSLIAAVSTNKIDMIASTLMITEERKQQIDFSEPYSELGASVFALKKNIESNTTKKLTRLDDIADKRVGVFTGTVHDAFVAGKYPQAKIMRYDSSADMIMSIKSGKIDVAMLDVLTARVAMKNISNNDIGILTDEALSLPLGFGFNKNNPALRDKFNSFLKEARADGTYDQMYERWIVNDPEKAVMPDMENSGTGEKIVLGVSVADLPYVAVMNGQYMGFDIEMLKRFAAHEGLQVEIVTMEFTSLIPALASGKVDIIADGIGITEERSKQINFSDSYVDFRTAVIGLKKNIASYDEQSGAPVTIPLLKNLSDSFYNNIILEDRYLLIVDGLKITAVISLFAAFFGTLLGALICFMRMSKNKLLNNIAKFYISIMRGTPVLVLLMIVFYVVFASVNINPVIVAILAFGANFGAYVSEMFRTSIESIDRGQEEAGIAGGFTRMQTFLYIIMPQALRQVLPVYKGEFISLVKMTSIVGYIAVQDLTKASDIIRSRTFDAFFPLIMVAVLYFIVSWSLALALDYIGLKIDPKRNRKTRRQQI